MAIADLVAVPRIGQAFDIEGRIAALMRKATHIGEALRPRLAQDVGEPGKTVG